VQIRISYDPAKRRRCLCERGLDFEDAAEILAGTTYQIIDDRQEYGEERTIAIGALKGRMVVLVYTLREGGAVHRIVSMRKANDREKERYGASIGLDRS
jgi:uncharacterized DUF497 family protein